MVHGAGRDLVVLCVERVSAIDQRLRLIAETDPLGAIGRCAGTGRGVNRNECCKGNEKKKKCAHHAREDIASLG